MGERERARKKKRAAGGPTLTSVMLDTSHSLRGWLKEVAPMKSRYAERGSGDPSESLVMGWRGGAVECMLQQRAAREREGRRERR